MSGTVWSHKIVDENFNSAGLLEQCWFFPRIEGNLMKSLCCLLTSLRVLHTTELALPRVINRPADPGAQELPGSLEIQTHELHPRFV